MKRPEKNIEQILKGYGRQMVLSGSDGEVKFKALLQPLRYKNKMYLSAVSTELRYDSSRKFLLIAPADVDVSNADGYECVISDGKNKYITDRSETIMFGQTPLYCWAVVTAM